MEAVSLSLIFVAYIGIRLLLGHHKTQAMKDRVKYSKGVDLVYANQYKEALQYFEGVLQQNPDSGLAWTFKAECHLHIGDFYTTLACADKALNIDYNLRDCYIFKGKALFELAQYEDALTEFDKAVWYFREKHPEAYFFRGLCHYELAKYEKAEYDFKKAVKLGDEDANYQLLKMQKELKGER